MHSIMNCPSGIIPNAMYRFRNYCPASAALLTIVFSCSCIRSPSISQLSGRYVAEYPYGKEELVLKDDGTYLQEIHLNSSAREIENVGKWRYDGERRRVELEKMYVVDDGFGRLRQDYEFPKLGLASFPVERNPFTGELRLAQGDSGSFTKR
jgi:hypothetical protein